ncbi:MAG: hypothetical protein MUO50_17975 [Longimicrobiales bacterium]|nr:hypothetical protein [Longimicrobiales bacterium]
MSEMPDIIHLGAEDEADRLWKGAKEAQAAASGDFVAMCQALDLGIRAAEILVTHRLQPVKNQFPATIGIQLDTPSPEVDAFRDAVTVPSSLPFTAILDLLSGEELECVAPGLHRGWEDRRFSCRRSRVTAGKALGITLDEAERQQLLLLAAYRNRIFRAPPPVRVVREEILGAFPVLSRLVEKLRT